MHSDNVTAVFTRIFPVKTKYFIFIVRSVFKRHLKSKVPVKVAVLSIDLSTDCGVDGVQKNNRELHGHLRKDISIATNHYSKVSFNKLIQYMKFRMLQISVFVCIIGTKSAALAQIPAGEIKGPFMMTSKIYPGTERSYWIYVPKQYDPSKPACSMVVQDGLSRATGWNLPHTLDSLIDKKQVPVIIGIFIDHGKVPSIGNDHYPRYNRSVEYDALGDRYDRFLLEEMLPEVERSYNLSKDPNDRSIAGASSGAICAFNAAWERPNEFRRVLSTIGTYVGLRGGDEFATLVRKTEPKPLRVFLEDGTHDLNIYAGDWWVANQGMLSALTFAGYDVKHAWGEGGGHDSKHAATIIADALSWLWKDYPAPVAAHRISSASINPVLEGEPWKEIKSDLKIKNLAVDQRGNLFATGKQAVFHVNEEMGLTVVAKLKGEIGGIGFAADGNLYVADLQQRKIISFDQKQVPHDVVTNVLALYMTASSTGIYFSDATEARVGFFSFNKKTVQYFSMPAHPTGLSISVEQTFLNVGFRDGLFGYSCKIAEDGSLLYGQDYIHYHIPYGKPFPDVQGLTTDSDNILYSATTIGIQASDQLGRVNFIFSKPADNATDVKLGGPEFDILYAVCDGKIFRRKIKARGALSWNSPIKPPKPGM